MCLKVPAIEGPRGVAGMLNYLKKFAVDIFPSMAATVIGAYIVNHYIVSKPATAAPAATASTANPKGEAKADAKADAKSADAKSVDAKSTETKSEKIRVILPSPIQPSAAPVTAAAPAAPVAVAAPAAPVEAATVAPEERRDANELARAAIERLRANGEPSPRTPEPARVHEAPKVAAAPVVTNAPAAAPALRPLPPPIMVSGSPAAEPTGQAPSQPRPPYAEAANPNRPSPPADIPVSRPLDLRAEMAEPSVRERA